MNLSDVPVEKCKGLNGLAIVGEVQVKDTASGTYSQVSVPLYFVPTKEDPTNGVSPADYDTLSHYGPVGSFDEAKALGLQTFHARFNLKPEWFTQEFVEQLKAGTVDNVEKTMYQINMAGITRSLFKALGLDAIDFSSIEPGSIIGFKAASGKSEPDKNQIRSFYYARRSA
jgi:hypothetical protein